MYGDQLCATGVCAPDPWQHTAGLGRRVPSHCAVVCPCIIRLCRVRLNVDFGTAADVLLLDINLARQLILPNNVRNKDMMGPCDRLSRDRCSDARGRQLSERKPSWIIL